MTILSYQNDPKVKEMFQARFDQHRVADEVLQGTGFSGGRGCFIGCTMNEYNHESFAKQIRPQWLAHLADSIFEGLPAIEAPQFGTDLLEAIPIGKDLEPVQWKLAVARHERQLEALKDNKEDYAVQCLDALQLIINYCRAKIEGTATEDQRKEAAHSARAAGSFDIVRSAADSALSAAYWSVTGSAVWSSALSAYWSAVWSSAELALSANSAESHWLWERDTLLKLLIEA